MANAAAHGRPKPYRGSRLRPVSGVKDKILLRDHPTFIRRDVAAVKSGGYLLIQRMVRKKVPRKLLDGELVERHILVECLDDPIPIGIHLAVVIKMDSVGIRVTRGVEPLAAPMLTPLGAPNIFFHHLFVRI